ncbi:hypothetical protein [Oricola sp.]|uniref:hypothetical protein n=1 Tax=Oricola sp. TaxID=1979950 RepID=UPI0025EDAA41|nr:hypothetical protein [Oricola sp.]MCI5073435.1 hypothetical protein [Oricola sp.]
MLARRFTLVCLAAAFAGGSLAMLIQETSRAPYSWKTETARACPFGLTRDCLRLLN